MHSLFLVPPWQFPLMYLKNSQNPYFAVLGASRLRLFTRDMWRPARYVSAGTMTNGGKRSAYKSGIHIKAVEVSDIVDSAVSFTIPPAATPTLDPIMFCDLVFCPSDFIAHRYTHFDISRQSKITYISPHVADERMLQTSWLT